METKKNHISVILATVIALAAIAAVAMIVYHNSGPAKAKRQLRLGEKYMAQLDYEQAINAYSLAIEEAPQLADAYLELAYAYLANKDRDAALATLQQGYEKTGDAGIGALTKFIEAQDGEEQAAAAAAAAATEAEQPQEEHRPEAESGYEEGNLFPDFTMTDKNGAAVSLADYRGKTLYLNFFTTWCTYCFYELPDMMELQETYGDQIQVVMVDLEESVQEAEAYARQYGVTLPINHVASWRIGNYEISGVPESFVLDADGIIVDKCEGMADYNWMESAIEKALDE